MRALRLALALLLPAGIAAAAAEEPRTVADRLVETFVRQGPAAFLDTVLAETALGEDNTARRAIQDNRARWLRELEPLGTAGDAQFAGERRFAPSLRSVCYVVRYPRAPLLFALRFYESPQGWVLLNHAWQTQERLAAWDCASGTATTTP